MLVDFFTTVLVARLVPLPVVLGCIGCGDGVAFTSTAVASLGLAIVEDFGSGRVPTFSLDWTGLNEDNGVFVLVELVFVGIVSAATSSDAGAGDADATVVVPKGVAAFEGAGILTGTTTGSGFISKLV
uniref:Putative secreted protein n=1 Tax=Anopheles darlingi TaxID=43151 RepID=A0A2M4DAE2_ANODA